MAELAGDPEVLRVGKLRTGQHLSENFKRTALMGHHRDIPGVTADGSHLHREGADVDAYIRHGRVTCNIECDPWPGFHLCGEWSKSHTPARLFP